MVKQYTLLTNAQRTELCKLVHEQGLTIKEAARRTGIPYPNAKAVNKTFEREKRTNKKHHKFLDIHSQDQFARGHSNSAGPFVRMLSHTPNESQSLDYERFRMMDELARNYETPQSFIQSATVKRRPQSEILISPQTSSSSSSETSLDGVNL